MVQPLRHWLLNDVDSIALTSPYGLPGSPALTRYCDNTEFVTDGQDKCAYPEPAEEVVAQWRQQLNERFFLFAGVLDHDKGLHTLLEAVADTDMIVVIAGNGPAEYALKRRACDLKLENVHFTGTLSEEDRLALLCLCYGVIFPSHVHVGTLDVSLLDGAMYSKPMISDEAGSGTTYVNIAGETALVVPREDVFALRSAMMHLWTQPELAARMGKFAHKRYQTLFTAEMMAKNYVRLYVDVISGNPKTP